MRIALLLMPLLLASCDDPEPTPAQQAARDEAKIASVEKAQDIPPAPVNLEPIGYPDIEKHDLLGASCAFAPEGGGIGALVLAMERGAYIKVARQLIRLAPDAGSPELPLGARGKYAGREYSLVFDLAEEEGEQEGIETVNYPARLVVSNARDQIVYQSNGVAQCGS